MFVKNLKLNTMKKLIYLFLTLLIVSCSSDDSSDNESNACNGDNPVFF